MSDNTIYQPCAHIEKTKPDDTIDKEIIEKLSHEYEVLPSFEKTVFEVKFVKHYSMEGNELLKCRWKQYRHSIDNRVFAPFQFPEMRDLHFYNGAIRFMPSLTVTKQPDHKMKLKPGPRVDWRGQVPIPYELMMKRGVMHKEDKKPRKRNEKSDAKIVKRETKKK